MKQILGKYPATSILGYIGGALTAASTLIPSFTNPTTHTIDWIQVLAGVAFALLGRKAADGSNTVSKN